MTQAILARRLTCMQAQVFPTLPGLQPPGACSLHALSPASCSHDTQVEWGSHALVVAARLLLAAALQDVNNLRFVLLSESALPLYAPAAVHQQLLAEERSRVNACGTGVRISAKLTYMLTQIWHAPCSGHAFAYSVQRRLLSLHAQLLWQHLAPLWSTTVLDAIGVYQDKL